MSSSASSSLSLLQCLSEHIRAALLLASLLRHRSLRQRNRQENGNKDFTKGSGLVPLLLRFLILVHMPALLSTADGPLP